MPICTFLKSCSYKKGTRSEYGDFMISPLEDNLGAGNFNRI